MSDFVGPRKPPPKPSVESQVDDGFVGPPRPRKRKREEEETLSTPSTNSAPPPKRRKTIEFEPLLANLPNQPLYEWSFSHFSAVTHIALTPRTSFLVSVSSDGFVKFWRRSFECVEFAKAFRVGKSRPYAVACSSDGSLAAISCSNDVSLGSSQTKTIHNVKIFDVLNVCVRNIVEIPFLPGRCMCFFPNPETRSEVLMMSQKDSHLLHVVDPDCESRDGDEDGEDAGSKGVLRTIDTFHRRTGPVVVLGYNSAYDTFVSGDSKGILEYWSPGRNYRFPDPSQSDLGPPYSRRAESVAFIRKSSTDLFEFARRKTFPLSITFDSSGRQFASVGHDRVVRVFQFATGKLTHRFDESVANICRFQDDELADERLKLHGLDFGKRIEREKVMITEGEDPLVVARAVAVGSPQEPFVDRAYEGSNVVFDESGMFLIYPSMLGIKIVNLVTKELVRLLGKHEHNFRFLQIQLVQGRPDIDRNQLAQIDRFRRKFSVISDPSETVNTEISVDPIVFCRAFRKNRFFLFTTRLFDEDFSAEGMSRDVINESDYDLAKLAELEELGARGESIPTRLKKPKTTLPTAAVIHTEWGDIRLRLYPKKCPRTVENFVTLSRRGYYNGVIFHRVIKNFMIQAGDPTGSGTGGKSIFGLHFEDEIDPSLALDKPFRLCMANQGRKDTNGSQFFITTVPAPWLTGKHSIFGDVVDGFDLVRRIEKARTSRYDKPYQDIKMMSVSIDETTVGASGPVEDDEENEVTS